jgi:hypothetical protein
MQISIKIKYCYKTGRCARFATIWHTACFLKKHKRFFDGNMKFITLWLESITIDKSELPVYSFE